MTLRTAGILAFGTVLAVAAAAAQAQGTVPLSYTIQQAEAGKAAYTANCVPCHGPHLSDGPTGAPRVPLFVLSHGVPDELPEGGVYTFVDDLETALARARETAGDRNISVMGADVGRQLMNAGAIDEISVHLVPVLFGSGTPMFGQGVDEHVTLEFVGVSESPHATHLRYRVVRDG